MDYFVMLKTILDYIENHIEDNFSVSKISELSGFSLSHVRLIFRGAIGRSLSSYVRSRKLSHSAGDLANSSSSIIDIAIKYGFSSHEAFTRAFKREFSLTPKMFRDKKLFISRTLIVPGIFGPMVIKKEDLVKMDNRKQVRKGEGYTILDGVPYISYFKQEEIEVTPYPSSLRAYLQYIGQQVSYSKLMSASGAAFRLMWNTEYWDGGNVDIMCIRKNPLEPLERGLSAVGRGFKFICKAGRSGHNIFERANNDSKKYNIRIGDKDEFKRFIINEIDKGRPVIGFGIIGPPEACIIAGYENDGNTLLGWNFFQDMPEFSKDLRKDPCGYFVKDNWYENQDTIGLLAVDDGCNQLEEKELLKEILSYALSIMKTERQGEYASGPLAYDQWAMALLKESEFPQNTPLPMLFERLMCHIDALSMIGEGRYQGSKYFEEVLGEYPNISDSLKKASKYLLDESHIALELWALIGGMGMSEKQALNLAKTEVREKSSKLILKAKEYYLKSVEYIEKALNDIKE